MSSENLIIVRKFNKRALNTNHRYIIITRCSGDFLFHIMCKAHFVFNIGETFIMINFEEELKNFKPSLEVEEAEQAIYNHELTDMTDVLQEMMQEFKRGI